MSCVSTIQTQAHNFDHFEKGEGFSDTERTLSNVCLESEKRGQWKTAKKSSFVWENRVDKAIVLPLFRKCKVSITNGAIPLYDQSGVVSME